MSIFGPHQTFVVIALQHRELQRNDCLCEQTTRTPDPEQILMLLCKKAKRTNGCLNVLLEPFQVSDGLDIAHCSEQVNNSYGDLAMSSPTIISKTPLIRLKKMSCQRGEIQVCV